MTKPIIVVKICSKLLYVIQVVKKIFLISNFLASTDIKVFGRTYLFAMLQLLLIGLALLEFEKKLLGFTKAPASPQRSVR